ncbi:MAG: NADH-quinone oxidoreductase subunit A [Micrococcales bacterium]|nr:NADH-quinone oxidoreductase subunit A [Micrococcales bacterium]
MSNPYVPLLIMMAVAGLLALAGLGVSWILGPHRFNRAKLDQYECGIEPSPKPQGGGRFPVRFYLVAMSFIIFDIEVVFLYPWAANFGELGLYSAIAIGIFLLLITVPFVYEWRRGAFDWDQ